MPLIRSLILSHLSRLGKLTAPAIRGKNRQNITIDVFKLVEFLDILLTGKLKPSIRTEFTDSLR